MTNKLWADDSRVLWYVHESILQNLKDVKVCPNKRKAKKVLNGLGYHHYSRKDGEYKHYKNVGQTATIETLQTIKPKEILKND